MAGVFISYRREDSPGHAGRIFDGLRTRLGGHVFMDVHGIDAGVDFVAAIDRAVGSCAALLAIVGPEWAAAADGKGQRRLDNPRDFVRLEIGNALKRGIPVIPVLVDEAKLPAANDLPQDLVPLVRRQAVVLRDSRWEADFDDLARSVERLVSPPGKTVRGGSVGQATPAPATKSWVLGAVAGLMMTAVGVGVAAGIRGCAPGSDETGATAARAPMPTATPAAVPPAVASEPVASLPSDAGDRAATPSVAGRATRDNRPVSAPRGRLGIGWFGLWLDRVSRNPPGVIVGAVAPGGPAAGAGIEADDLLVGVAGRTVASFTDVENAVVGHVRNEPPNTPAAVHVVRDGKRLELLVVFDREFVLRR